MLPKNDAEFFEGLARAICAADGHDPENFWRRYEKHAHAAARFIEPVMDEVFAEATKPIVKKMEDMIRTGRRRLSRPSLSGGSHTSKRDDQATISGRDVKSGSEAFAENPAPPAGD